MFKRLHLHLSKVVNPVDHTSDGFRLTRRKFTVPDDTLTLEPATKREIAICNLFANECQSIGKIVELLDTDTRQVVTALIQGGLIHERRRSGGKVKHERRRSLRYHLPWAWESGRTDRSWSLCGLGGEETVGEFIFFEVIRSDERCEQCWTRSAKSKLQKTPGSKTDKDARNPLSALSY